jgi:hypothetical protein
MLRALNFFIFLFQKTNELCPGHFSGFSGREKAGKLRYKRQVLLAFASSLERWHGITSYELSQNSLYRTDRSSWKITQAELLRRI